MEKRKKTNKKHKSQYTEWYTQGRKPKKIKRERDDHPTALKCSRDPQDIQKGIGMCRDAFDGVFFIFYFAADSKDRKQAVVDVLHDERIQIAQKRQQMFRLVHSGETDSAV